MKGAPKGPTPGGYKIGYGRPPAYARFRPGVSGNPGGRPRGISPARANKFALQEAYRPINIRDGDEIRRLPAFQAVMRQLTRNAVKGNGPAQRALIAIVQAIEQDAAIQAEIKTPEGNQNSFVTDQDRVRALAAFVQKAKLET